MAAFAGEEVGISLFALCELWSGVEQSSRPTEERKKVEALVAGLAVVAPDERLAPTYGRLVVGLARGGKAIATMDLLIAATALVEGATLLTRNRRHFDRVPGLEVIGY